jgi:hypothetical protein
LTLLNNPIFIKLKKEAADLTHCISKIRSLFLWLAVLSLSKKLEAYSTSVVPSARISTNNTSVVALETLPLTKHHRYGRLC